MTPADWVSAFLLFAPALLLGPLPWWLRRWRPDMGGGALVVLALLAVAVFGALELAMFEPIARAASRFRADAVMVSFHVIFGLILASLVVLVSGIFAVLSRRHAA